MLRKLLLTLPLLLIPGMAQAEIGGKTDRDRVNRGRIAAIYITENTDKFANSVRMTSEGGPPNAVH